LLISHFIATTASIWTAKPILRAGSGPIDASRLLKYSPRDECHADNRYMTEHVVWDREWIAYIKPESQTPKTKQQNAGDVANVDWCVPQRVEIWI